MGIRLCSQYRPCIRQSRPTIDRASLGYLLPLGNVGDGIVDVVHEKVLVERAWLFGVVTLSIECDGSLQHNMDPFLRHPAKRESRRRSEKGQKER